MRPRDLEEVVVEAADALLRAAAVDGAAAREREMLEAAQQAAARHRARLEWLLAFREDLPAVDSEGLDEGTAFELPESVPPAYSLEERPGERPPAEFVPVDGVAPGRALVRAVGGGWVLVDLSKFGGGA